MWDDEYQGEMYNIQVYPPNISASETVSVLPPYHLEAATFVISLF